MSASPELPSSDAESRLSDGDQVSLRLWLRLLTCTAMIEHRVRDQLRERFDISLARFDLMAQLARTPKGLKMSELSRRLMVTGGNVTGLTDQLVSEGLVVRHEVAHDRRAYAVRLTPKGKRQFDTMAAEHERWIAEMLAGMPLEALDALHHLLGTLKSTVAAKSEARTGTGR